MFPVDRVLPVILPAQHHLSLQDVLLVLSSIRLTVNATNTSQSPRTLKYIHTPFPVIIPEGSKVSSSSVCGALVPSIGQRPLRIKSVPLRKILVFL